MSKEHTVYHQPGSISPREPKRVSDEGYFNSGRAAKKNLGNSDHHTDEKRAWILGERNLMAHQRNEDDEIGISRVVQ